MAQKIVLHSQINLSGTRAVVQLGNRHFADVFRAEGVWNAITPTGTRILPRIPHEVRDERGRLKSEVSLGVVIKLLRERLEEKLGLRAIVAEAVQR